MEQNMSKPIDLELKKAFTELQTKMVDTKKKLHQIDTQLNVLKRVKQHLDITEREISSLSSDTKTYESVGRMFVLTDLSEVMSNLKNRQESVGSGTVELENSKKILEKNLDESKENIKEMVQQRKDHPDAVKVN